MVSEYKKIIFLTNIVAPYRISFFNYLEAFRKSNFSDQFDFEVYFMRLSEKDRNWNVNLNSLKFKFFIGK